MSALNLFQKRLNIKRNNGTMAASLESIKNFMDSNLRAHSPQLAKMATATEGFTQEESQILESTLDSGYTFLKSLEDFKTGLSVDRVVNGKKETIQMGVATEAHAAAALVSMVNGQDLKAFFRAERQRPVAGQDEVLVQIPSGSDVYTGYHHSMEAYEEKENKNAALYSVMYNMRASRQGEFGEAFFPTVTLSNDQVGFGVTIRLIQVLDNFTRDTTGAVTNQNRKNVLEAAVDATVLKSDLTKMAPVHRAGAEANFLIDAIVPVTTINNDGVMISTAPLKMGREFSLLSLCQTDESLAAGVVDFTDTIDPAIELSAVYLKFGADVIRVKTMNYQGNNFLAAPQGDSRAMVLNFNPNTVMLRKDTKNADGSDLAVLTGLNGSDLIATIGFSVTGNLQTDEQTPTSVNATGIRVINVRNSSGDIVSHTSAGAAKTLADLILAGTVAGYDLKAYKTNANRRERGQLMDVRKFTQIYTVPLRGPISVLRPVMEMGTDGDAADLAALVTVTQIRLDNAAVGKLFETRDMLIETLDGRVASSYGLGPAIMGVGRHIVKATYETRPLNMATDLDSLTSSDRAADMRALLINSLRDVVYKMWTNSNFKPAADAQAGGVTNTPTVIVGTSLELQKYLMVEGDFRLIGPDFNVRLVATPDSRMVDKIFVAFGYFDGNENKVNPLHFGAMAWKPEQTVVLPISRNGQVSKELTVQPSYLHVVNTPVLGYITVAGLSDVVAKKVNINMDIQ